MSFKNKVVEFIIKGRDLLSAPTKTAEKEASKLEKTIEILNAELARDEAQKQSILRYQALSKSLVENQKSYQAASIKAAELSRAKKDASQSSKRLEKSLSDAELALKKLEDEFDSTGRTSSTLNQSIQEQRTEVERVSNEYKDSIRVLSEHDLALKNSRSGVNKLASSLSKGRSEFAQLEKKLAKQNVDLTNLGDAYKKLETKQLGATKALDSVSQKLSKQKRTLDSTSRSAKDYSGNISLATSDLISMAAAYIGLDKLTESLSNVFSVGSKFELLAVQMNGLMGSIAGGKQASQWIKEFTKSTPLQLSEVSQAFVKLKAFGLDPMDGTLQSITDSALKLGGGFQEVEGISLALGQAWAKQKLQGEEILQLVERGVPVWDMLQNVTGKNVQELQKLSSAGQLGRDVIKQLIDEMGRTSTGAAADQMALFSGQVSNAKDNLDQFYNLIAQSGAMDWLKSQINDLNKSFAQMASDGSLKRWAKSISDTIVATGESIKLAVSTIVDYKEEITSLIKVWLALKVGTYFSNVVSGARAAMTSLASYVISLKTVNQQTEATSKSSVRLGNILKSVGAISAYTILIDQLANLYFEYKKLILIQNEVNKSRREAELSAAKLAAEFKNISESTGIAITNMQSFDKALSDGLIVLNETTGLYEGVAKKQERLAETTRIAAEEERKRQELLRLTIPEALSVIETLEQQAQNLNGVRAGVDGFIQSIESARTALAGAGAEYSQQLVLLDSLKAKFESHNESLARQAYLTNDVSKAYKELGITSADALTQAATKLQGAFELLQQSNEPVAMQQAAFLKWSQAAIEAASATDQTVPASVQAAAAALGLTAELDKLVNAANKLKPATDINSDAVNRFAAALDKTKAAMENHKRILDSSTASAEQKRKAQAALNHQTGLVVEQEADLARVRKLETKSLQQLSLEQRKLEQELAQVNQQYQVGALSAEDYQHKKDRVSQILSVVNNLLGDFKNAQDAATDATKRGTRATEDATKANERSLKSLRQQKEELEKVSQSANRAATSMSNYQNRNRPTVEQIVDYQDKYETGRGAAYRFESAEVIAERARREREKMQQQQYAQFERAINASTSTSELSKIYDRIFKQLVYIDGEQKRALRDLIDRQRESLKAVASAKRNPTRSNTITPRENTEYYSPSPVPTRPNNSSPLSDAVNGKLDKLLTLLTGQQSGKRIVLELKLPSGNTAELYTTIRDQLLEELEQLSNAQ
ncbi:tape measure protein [Pseudoalteromonas piscicida]|uniref:tape measure protein n=1 Tax=Pseudoalteromonas piscicida TaxID=43662 RepID=UPI0009E62856|nr:tape measure protein [Pseudoalteromonas piscicida]